MRRRDFAGLLVTAGLGAGAMSEAIGKAVRDDNPQLYRTSHELRLQVRHADVGKWEEMLGACGFRILGASCELSTEGHDDLVDAQTFDPAVRKRWETEFVVVEYDQLPKWGGPGPAPGAVRVKGGLALTSMRWKEVRP